MSKKLLLILVLIIGSVQSYSQNNQESTKQGSAEWRYTQKYNQLIQSRIFSEGMSDDEMAGILLSRAGRNLKLSFVFETAGVIIASAMTYVNNDTKTSLFVASAVGVGFFIAALCELLNGYHKISSAGIIFQHKGINVKPTGAGISLNF